MIYQEMNNVEQRLIIFSNDKKQLFLLIKKKFKIFSIVIFSKCRLKK